MYHSSAGGQYIQKDPAPWLSEEDAGLTVVNDPLIADRGEK